MMVAGTTAHQGAETENESKYKGWRVAACKKLSQTYVKINSAPPQKKKKKKKKKK